MAKKAVYNNQHLAIYITQDDYETFLDDYTITVPVFIGKSKTELGGIVVKLGPVAHHALAVALTAERQAVQEVQDQFAKENPNYTSSTDIQRRQKRARKRLR